MPIKAIVTDIEGTTTSISFVKDKLFPYAVEHVQEYLTENWTNADVQEAVKELREQYVKDVTDKVEGAVAISDEEGKEQSEQIVEVVANVKWQVSIDRKTTSLKKLQGLIWAKGYNSGAIKGHVYSDVPKAFERWTADNIKIYIYSSGSVAAQKLLFANSEHGDLTAKISGYFDTNIGMKQEKHSYEKIIKEVGCEPVDILFLTDIVNEAVAAKDAGIKVALLIRSGNGPLSDEEKAEYETFTSFDDIHSEFVTGKRKLDDIVTAETNAVKIAKLSDDESVITSETNAESVTETNAESVTETNAESVAETNGIDRTDTKMETQVSNGDELTTKNDEKTETKDIPITQTECDFKNKIVNLDVDVVAQDIIKGEKDSKPQIEVDDVIKTNEPLPMEVVDEKPSETKEIAETKETPEIKETPATKETPEDIEMEVTPTDTELNSKPKSDVIEVDESTKVVKDVTDIDPKNVAEQVPAIADITSDVQTEKTELVDKVSSEEIVDKNNAETTDVSLKQNGDHTDSNVEKGNGKADDTKPKTESDEPVSITVASESKDSTNQPKEETESNEEKEKEIENGKETEVEAEKIESVEKVVALENGAKEAIQETENKENIPVEIKENIIEIPIHIDGDNQSAQKPSIVSATNGNGVASKDDSTLEAAPAAATNSNKEKMSRIELIIEEKNNDNGQLTETTTHIVKEIIVKNNACETAVENVEIMPENV